MHEPGEEHLRTGTSWLCLEQKGSEGGVGRVSERSGDWRGVMEEGNMEANRGQIFQPKRERGLGLSGGQWGAMEGCRQRQDMVR